MKQKTKQPDIRPFTHQFYRGNHLNLFLSSLQLFPMVAANLLLSWLLQQTLDLVAGVDVGYSLGELAIVALCTVAGIAFSYLFAYWSRPRFIAKAIGQYKTYVFERLSQKNISAFSGENTNLYISALSNDAASIEKGYLGNMFQIIGDLTLCVTALGMMFWYSPVLTFVSIGLSLLPVLAALITGNRVAEAEKQVSDLNENYMSTLRDSLVGFSVVKSFRAELQMCRMFASCIQEVSKAKELRQKLTILIEMLSTIAGVIVQFGVFLVGAYLALSGKGVTAGTVLIFVQLLNYVLNPIGSVPNLLAEWKAARALIAKLSAALDENVRKEGQEDKRLLDSKITLQGLSFGYEPEKPVLQDVDYTFHSGRSYALVGPSGSGKSTLLNLLMASHDNYYGTIEYDNTELRNIRTEGLYEMVSVVQQNVFIFNASIRDNITMFSDFPKEEVERAIALSGLTQLIEKRGEEYLCGENGSGLSGGEKQRISIARSLLKKSQVLLVDEATAALDAQTAFQVSSAILDLQDMTRIVITHALDENLLKRYDCILTMKNGRIAEAGSFDALMEKKGFFYSLFTVSQ